MNHSIPPFVMLNLFQHNALSLVILKQVQDDDNWVRDDEFGFSAGAVL